MNRESALVIFALLCHMAQAQASAPREVRDGATVEAKIAADAPTRIRLDGQRIVNAVGNIHSASNCDAHPAAGATPSSPLAAPTAPLAAPAVNPRGDLVLNCDLEKGEIFVRPAAAGSTKALSLFVSSSRATYTLLLRPSAMPAATIVLRDRTIGPEPVTAAGTGRAAGHVRALKTMLIAMTGGRAQDGVQVEEVDTAYALWGEADFRLIRRYQGPALVGETYRLRNIGTVPMVLAEQEFDRDGVNLLAVAIERHTLQPGETSLVHIIRGGRP